MGFKLGSEKRQTRNSSNTPIVRKNLGDGILGEANMDGSIYVDKSVPKGSALEKKVVAHESQHLRDMSNGSLSYTDDYVRYNGTTYPRRDGKIKYNGKWSEEGSNSFPWEKKAVKAEKNVK
tara:strand:+ start:394 stop:756 length:363 start_codon:yes stop_codon:yes gene_type:complete